MGTPSRVKGGLQEMRTVVELMETTVRLLTDSNRPAHDDYAFHNSILVVYLVPVVVLGHFHQLLMVIY